MRNQIVLRKIKVFWTVPECEMRRWERVVVTVLVVIFSFGISGLAIYLNFWR